ncbi:MAG: DsbA family oxidoreductase [Rhizobiaceae bacterium]|nr:DsbA family oxidoreductase [Rhizobiaceae bacterium]
MADKQILEIDVISDVMCPWCYIGKTNLDAAIAEVEDLDVVVRWRPYQLDGTLPKEGLDRATYLNNKFGGEERAQEIYGRIRDAGKALGIDFNFEAMKVSPNTLDAHRVIMWAGGQSPEIQNKLVERLFEIFFLEGGNIGLDEVLVQAAEHAGMDSKIVDDLLKKDDDKDRVSGEIDHARQMGVQGVPCFIVDNKYAVMGAQPPEQLVGAFRHAIAEREKADN